MRPSQDHDDEPSIPGKDGSSLIVRRIGWIAAILCLLICLGHAIPRDIRLQEEYCADLRVRIVGARLMKDGRSPYFYKWTKNDGLRYYDPTNFISPGVSNITGTPFLHQVLYPLAEMPEKQISLIWLGLEYLFFLCMATSAFLLCKADHQRWFVTILAGIFLLTEAWKDHIGTGQIYLFMPLLAMAVFLFLQRGNRLKYALPAGIAAAALVFIRPNALLALLPLLAIRRRYSIRYIVLFSLPGLLIAGWILAKPGELSFWRSYRDGMAAQLQLHVGQPVSTLYPPLAQDPDPDFRSFEGIDRDAAARIEKTDREKIYSENGNVFVIVRLLFHFRPSPGILGLSAAIIMLFLLVLFFRKFGYDPSLARIVLFGYCLYMISDLFSPIYRHQYYTVQWIFPLFLAATLFPISWPARRGFRGNAREFGPYILLLVGLLLNIGHGLFPMMHTVGEYMLLAACLSLVFLAQTGFLEEGRPETTIK